MNARLFVCGRYFFGVVVSVMAGPVPAIHVLTVARKEDVDARDPPPLAVRVSAGLSPPKRLSAKADERGHDERNEAKGPGFLPGLCISC
jgi:hypothetical protein